MWQTVIILGCSIGAVLATPIGLKNMPIMAEEPMGTQKTEMAMSTLNLPSNATSIRADITDGFTCANKTYGYYADVENDCQIFHVCLPVVYPDGRENTFRWSFICPEETLFSQESFTCVRGEDMNFGCEESERFYELNRNFGMSPDASMEMSSMEADMDEYYVKSELGASVASRPSEALEDETISEIIVPLIKEVEMKKENQRPLTYSDRKKTPLRTSPNKPKLETSKKPVTTTTTKRTPNKYNKIQRRPTMPQITTVKEIHKEVKESLIQNPIVKTTILYERLTTLKPVIMNENTVALPLQEEPSQIMPVNTEEVIKIITNENAMHENQMFKDSVQIIAPSMVDSETTPQKNDVSTDDVTTSKSDVIQTPLEKKNVEENLPSKTADDELETQKNEDTKKEKVQVDMKEDEEEEILNPIISEIKETMPNAPEPEDIISEDVVNQTPKDVSGITFTNEMNLPKDDTKETMMETQQPKNEEKTEELTEVLTNSENIGEAHKEEINSEMQEEMIIKTISDLMNAANLANTADVSASEPIKSENSAEESNLPAVADSDQKGETLKTKDENESSLEKENADEAKPLSSENVQISEDTQTSVKNEQISELANESLLEEEKKQDKHEENKESSQYTVDVLAISNLLQSLDNKNDLENLDKIENEKETSSAEKTSLDEEPQISLVSDNSEKSPAVEGPYTMHGSQEVLGEETQEVLGEEKQDDLEAMPYIPIHELLMNPSQSSFESSGEQVIPVLIVNDNNQDQPIIIAQEDNQAEETENLHDNIDLSKSTTEEEVKPIYNRLQEFHSNLLKTDLLSADLDDEPSIHDIFNNPEETILPESDSSNSQKSTENLSILDETLISPNESNEKSDDKIDFLLQTNASKDSLKVIPLVTEEMPESLENISPNLSHSESSLKTEEDVKSSEIVASSPLERLDVSRRLKKKMDPRKRRFLFKADTS